MDKEKYKGIRDSKVTLLHTYYLENGGTLKDTNTFINMLSKWCVIKDPKVMFSSEAPYKVIYNWLTNKLDKKFEL